MYPVVGDAGPTVRTTVLVVCVVSIIALGGSTNYALKRLNIRTGVGAKSDDIGDGVSGLPDVPGEDGEDTDSSISEQSDLMDDDDDDAAADDFYADGGDAENNWDAEGVEKVSHWFTDFDDAYLKPVFSRYDASYACCLSAFTGTRERFDHTG